VLACAGGRGAAARARVGKVNRLEGQPRTHIAPPPMPSSSPPIPARSTSSASPAPG
jgi:hypothetical protein